MGTERPNVRFKMRSAFLVASLLLNASVLSAAVTKCYNCIEVGGSWSDCQRSQTRKKCNALLGNTHCYSASGKYDNGTTVLDVVARGCIDCSDKKKACEKLELLLKVMSYKLVSCDIACCTQDRCNTMIPTTRQSSTRPTSSGVLAMYSTSAKISLSMILFVLTASLRLVLL